MMETLMQNPQSSLMLNRCNPIIIINYSFYLSEK